MQRALGLRGRMVPAARAAGLRAPPGAWASWPAPLAAAAPAVRGLAAGVGAGARRGLASAASGGDGGDGSKGYRTPEGDYAPTSASGAFPDSWVEPDALWDYAESHRDGNVDDRFVAEFGERNKKWKQKMLAEDPTLFDKIGAGQSPKYLWIGCCDSRVAAETLIDAKPGEIFVHRNIANLVVSTDTNLRSVLHYAVHYLKVEHIIVCGHYDCGGVKAASSKQDHDAPVESWLTNIRDVIRLHQDELSAIADGEERHKRLVELSVIEQCLNLFKTGDVQRRRSETATRPDLYECAFPRIHGMVFEPSDGILRKLPIDFKHYLHKYKDVYQMYEADHFLASMHGAAE